jgi:hypothetical protein
MDKCRYLHCDYGIISASIKAQWVGRDIYGRVILDSADGYLYENEEEDYPVNPLAVCG